MERRGKCCDSVMLAYSLFYSSGETRGGKTTIWSLKRMKRKEGKIRGRRKEKKVGELEWIGRSRDGDAYGDWVSRRVRVQAVQCVTAGKGSRALRLAPA